MKKLTATSVFLTEELIYGFAVTLAFTTHIIYRVEILQLDALQLVLLGTALETTIFIFEIPTGIVADIYSRRLSSIIGFSLLGLAIAAEGIFPLFLALLLAQIVSGLGHTFLSGAYQAWITDEVGTKNVGALFLRGGQLDKLGSLLAIPVAVFIGKINLAIPYLISGGLLLALTTYLILFMPETGFKPVPKQERQRWRSMIGQFNEGAKLLRSRRVLVIFTLVALLLGLYSEAWDRLAQPYLLENFVFPTFGNLELDTVTWFGIFKTGGLLLGILADWIARQRVDSSQPTRILGALQRIYAVMVLAFLLFAITNTFFLAVVCMFLFNTLRGVTFPLTSAWLNQQIDSKIRATVLSMTGQIDALGELGGGPILGLIGRLRSLRTALFTSALLLSPVGLLFRQISTDFTLEKSP